MADMSKSNLQGPGSAVVPDRYDNAADTTFSELLAGEDAKVKKANANLQARLAEVASLPDSYAGGMDSLDEDASDQRE